MNVFKRLYSSIYSNMWLLLINDQFMIQLFLFIVVDELNLKFCVCPCNATSLIVFKKNWSRCCSCMSNNNTVCEASLQIGFPIDASCSINDHFCKECLLSHHGAKVMQIILWNLPNWSVVVSPSPATNLVSSISAGTVLYWRIYCERDAFSA